MLKYFKLKESIKGIEKKLVLLCKAVQINNRLLMASGNKLIAIWIIKAYANNINRFGINKKWNIKKEAR
ncbi:hypothetical protein Trebr_0284 [Treponema brennaborense DSM 12168]|uniref:Uncharacterized protein n=1 Tax=Treponema brennaborense (strain DSM 12168 / CIP 105900 / DD5/3) TaxID=906968 RepID=F4LMH1_TREBD|nr:hypothetical protein Trebr_0284 [Treponema brennaborense DSM 12168]